MVELRRIIFLFIIIFLTNKSKNVDLNNIKIIEGSAIFEVFPFQLPNKDFIFLCYDYNPDNHEHSFIIYELRSSREISSENTMDWFELSADKFITTVLTIDNNYYIIFCNLEDCYSIDFVNMNYEVKEFHSLLQETVDSTIYDEYWEWDTFYFSEIINIDNRNKILFSQISNNNIYLSIVKINNKELSFESIAESTEGPYVYTYPHDLNCFITTNNYIECLYMDEIESQSHFRVAVYEQSLNYLNNIILDTDNINFQDEVSFYNAIRAIHLKNEIGIFTYYINNYDAQFSKLRMQINELYFEGGIPSFRNVIQDNQIIEISFDDDDDYNYYSSDSTRINSESLIKLNDNKFSYAYIYSEDIIILIIFDLFGDNNNNLFVRYYKIDFTDYNYKTRDILKLFNYDSFLGLGINYKDSENNKNALFIFFGYYKIQSNNKISLDVYKENKGFIFEINNYNLISLDNNLFGYELIIKITSISNALKGTRFFSINKNMEIHKNDLIDKDDHILIDFSGVNTQIGEKSIIEITWTLATSEYDKLVEYYDKSETFGGGEQFSDFYESTVLEEKIFTIELTFVCSESSETITSFCSYPVLKTKTIQNGSNNIIFLSDFIYTNEANNLFNTYLTLSGYDSTTSCSNDPINIIKYNYMNDCLNNCPTNYNHDSSNNCIYVCENKFSFNSKCYDNCPEGAISYLSNDQKSCKCEKLYYKDENLNYVCLSSLICDNKHPVLNEQTKECCNYRVKYRDEYYMECPENTCISQKFGENNICEDKTPDMKVFNGICFNDYHSIQSKFREMAENNIKLNDKEGVTLSV